MGVDKTYCGTITLGATTDTLDSEGVVLAERDVCVSEADVLAVLPRFRGDIEQIPPMYSAKKQAGKPLYKLARKGLEVEREPKAVTIRQLELLSFAEKTVKIRVSCTSGTYVRVLAADIGEALGCGAHLSALRREAVGEFTLEQAVLMQALKEDPESLPQYLVTMSDALATLPRIELPKLLQHRVCGGYQLSVADLRVLDVPEFADEDVLTLAEDGGEVLAVARALLPSSDLAWARRDQRALKTERVLAA
jgi:tRNA pseudouridine55 synthase